jgi:3-hydroxybutyryl-CoA dehydrogenase
LILKRIGVIGAGVMGVGLAQALAQTQQDMVLVDIHDNILAEARDRIYQNICLTRLFDFSPESDKTPDERISQITFATDYKQLRGVDFVLRDVSHR